MTSKFLRYHATILGRAWMPATIASIARNFVADSDEAAITECERHGDFSEVIDFTLVRETRDHARIDELTETVTITYTTLRNWQDGANELAYLSTLDEDAS